MNALAPIGRVMFSLIFLLSVPNHFKQATVDYAAAAGVPLAHVAVPLAGIVALIGGLSIALGFHARLGAIALLVFLVPVTLFMHRFWGLGDPQQVHMQQANFMKNLALMGAALFFVYAGSGAYSLDSRMHRGELMPH
jgi:putative oxidoreductase